VIDIYEKTTKDLLMIKPLPLYFSQIDPSFGKAYVNLGELNNKGGEFAAIFKDQIGNLRYELSGNIARNLNKIVALDGGQPPVVGITMVKENVPLGTFYGYKVEGIFQDQDEIENHAYQTSKTAPGDFKYEDFNNDGKIDGSDRTYIGNAFPKFNYGFTGTAYYQGFDLNIFTQGVYGNKIYNLLRQNVLNDLSLNSNVSTDMLRYWGRELDDGTTITDTNIPKLGKDANNNKRFSDFFLEDGSYFRFKTITLGYTLSDNWASNLKLQGLRVYFTAQNLLTFTNYSGFDPEIGQSNGWNPNPLDFGIDGGAYPQPRMFIAGVNLSF
jgi:hypothetical protein